MQYPLIPERVEWSRSPVLPSVDILRADNCARRWRVFHETYTVCTVLAAFGPPAEWKYRHKTHHSQGRGSIMLMEPGEVHPNTGVTAPATFRVLMIDPAVVERAAEELGIVPSRPHLEVAQLRDPAPFRAFAALHTSLERSSTTLERQSRFAICLRILLERCTEASPRSLPKRADSPTVSRARAFIHEHVAEQIELEELVAAAGGVSRFHLVHAFTSEVGLPPHAYQIHLRIRRSRALLAAGMPLGGIAADLGFADQSHFGRHFRRVVGVTPGAYANATLTLRLTDRPLISPPTA